MTWSISRFCQSNMLSGAYPPGRRRICTRRSVSPRGKTPSPAGLLTATSAACLARTTVNNRLGNLLLVIAARITVRRGRIEKNAPEGSIFHASESGAAEQHSLSPASSVDANPRDISIHTTTDGRG